MFVNTKTQPIFVGRQELLYTFFQHILRFLKNKNTRFFFHLYAFTGMGKTWLVWMLFLAVRESRQSNSCWISFAGVDEQPPFSEPPTWLSRVLHYNPQRLRPDVSRHNPFLKDVCGALLRRYHLHDQAAKLDSALGKLQLRVTAVLPEADLPVQQDKKLVLFLDALDQLEHNPAIDGGFVWEALQEHLLRPLYLTGNVLCFTTGQAPMVWRFFDLARVVKDEQLLGLTKQELGEMARLYRLDPIAEEIEKLTHGHAYLSQHLFEEAHERLEAAPGVEPPPLPSVEVARALPPDDLSDRAAQLSPLARTLLPAAALLRSLELDVLSAGLQAVPGAHPPDLHPADLIAALRAYLGADFAVERSDIPLQYHWRVELRPALEQVAAAALSPEARQQLHAAFAAGYRQKIEREPKNFGFLISEWMVQSLSALPEAGAAGGEPHAWGEQFRRLWWAAGSQERRGAIEQDALVERLLITRGCWEEAVAVMSFIPEYQQQRAELYPRILEHLRHQRFTQRREALEAGDFELLRDLAKLPNFAVSDLRSLLGKRRARPPGEGDVPLTQAMDKLDQLTESYVVEYDAEQNGFVVESWLRAVLLDWNKEVAHEHPDSRR